MERVHQYQLRTLLSSHHCVKLRVMESCGAACSLSKCRKISIKLSFLVSLSDLSSHFVSFATRHSIYDFFLLMSSKIKYNKHIFIHYFSYNYVTHKRTQTTNQFPYYDLIIHSQTLKHQYDPSPINQEMQKYFENSSLGINSLRLKQSKPRNQMQ
jgi:hypothetical protein